MTAYGRKRPFDFAHFWVSERPLSGKAVAAHVRQWHPASRMRQLRRQVYPENRKAASQPLRRFPATVPRIDFGFPLIAAAAMMFEVRGEFRRNPLR